MKNLRHKIYIWLRWSEKYLKTDMVYLGKGSTWLTLGQVASSGSSFVLSLAFANLWPLETYGIYKYLLSIVSLLTIFSLTGLNTSIFQAVARGYDGEMMAGLITRMKWSLIGSASGLAIAGYYYINDNYNLFICFLLISVFLPLSEPLAIYDSLLQGKKLFNISTYYFVSTQIVISASTIIALWFNKSLIFIILIYFLSRIATRLFFFHRTYNKFVLNDYRDPQSIKYGKHLSLLGAVGLGISSLNNILLFHFLGSEKLSVFAIAIAPIDQVRALFKSISGLVIPKAATADPKILHPLRLFKKLLPFIIIVISGTLIYVFLAPAFYGLVFPKYTQSIFYSQIFAISIVFSTVNSILLGILRARKRIKALYILNIVDAAIGLCMVVPMIYYLKITGLILTLIIGKVVSTVLMTWLVFEKSSDIKQNT